MAETCWLYGERMKKKKIAIIGTGISGLTCGYTLTQNHEVTLYEASDYIGGHTHTVTVEKDGESSDIDTGFIVFNDRTYPEFMKLMDAIGVHYQPTEMSFSVKNDALDLEYNGNSINSLFAQRSNLLKPSFLRMLKDIAQFNQDVRRAAKTDESLTIGRYLEINKYGELFENNYLLPMISAIWSMGMDSCKDFPLRFFVTFFENHGLLDLTNRPQWYTIVGGSSRYIEPLTREFHDRIKINNRVTSVKRHEKGVEVITKDHREKYDEVIFACHGDHALDMIDHPLPQEKKTLSKFSFSENQVVLHTDESFLPKRRLAWASWNYNMRDNARQETTLTYNMNILQRLKKKSTYLVTLNQDIEDRHVLGRFNYSHPVYRKESLEAQTEWSLISGVDRLHFCGAYWFSGFHEDGVRSALRVCSNMEEQR